MNYKTVLVFFFLIFQFNLIIAECELESLKDLKISGPLNFLNKMGSENLWNQIKSNSEPVYTGPTRLSFIKNNTQRDLQCIEMQRVDFLLPDKTTEPYGPIEYVCFKSFSETESINAIQEMKTIDAVMQREINGVKYLECGNTLRCNVNRLGLSQCKAQIGQWISGDVLKSNR